VVRGLARNTQSPAAMSFCPGRITQQSGREQFAKFRADIVEQIVPVHVLASILRSRSECNTPVCRRSEATIDADQDQSSCLCSASIVAIAAEPPRRMVDN